MLCLQVCAVDAFGEQSYGERIYDYVDIFLL